MIGAFSFNGVEAESFNLICKSVKRPLLPPAKVNRVELAGASGAYDFENSEYGLRQVTMRIVYVGTSFNELRSRARLIAAWLSTYSWARLIINDETDKYYLAKVTNEIDLQNLWEAGTAEISFDCQPFAYSVQEQIIPGSNFINPGTRKINYKSPYGSKFIITATVNGSGSFTVNDKTITYSGVSGQLMIDSINMEATINGQNAFSHLSGDIDTFFTINPGQNSMTASGTSDITISYIPMWL